MLLVPGPHFEWWGMGIHLAFSISIIISVDEISCLLVSPITCKLSKERNSALSLHVPSSSRVPRIKSVLKIFLLDMEKRVKIFKRGSGFTPENQQGPVWIQLTEDPCLGPQRNLMAARHGIPESSLDVCPVSSHWVIPWKRSLESMLKV